MRRVVFLFVFVCLLFTGAVATFAQSQAPAGPPPVLQIYREDVKPGKTAAHEKVETGWPRAFAAANSPTHYLAMTSVTGPNEAWFLTGYPNLAAWEQDVKNNDSNATLSAELSRLSQQDGELLNSVRSITAAYRTDLSYRSGGSIATMRYFLVTTIRVRPGFENDFNEGWRMVVAAHEKANMNERWAMYQVTAGAPAGTFIYFGALKSLAEVDATAGMHSADAYQSAVGDEGRKRLREMNRAGTITSETNYYAFNPAMSYVSKEWIAADPGFWTPKPTVATKKTTTVKPAGQQ